MGKNLISIIVPCYNVEQYLKDFLLSVENISYPSFEVIFVDDGSSDSTKEILDNFCKSHKFARTIHQSNAGVSIARNNGLNEAKGKYVIFFDSDDIFHPDMLSILHNVLVKTDADASSCRHKLINGKSHYRKKYREQKIKKIYSAFGKDDTMVNILSLISITVWHTLLKRSVLEKMPNFPNLFKTGCVRGEDSLFICQYFSNINKFSYVKNKLYYYRTRKLSITHKNIASNETNFFETENFLRLLDKDVYQKSQLYIHSSSCLEDMGIINVISHSSNYHNPDFAKLVYKKYCEELPYVKKAKLYPLAYRFGTMFTKPVMYLMIRKKLKG